MPLEILAMMVVIGLTVVIGVVHLTGGSVKPQGFDKASAQQRFAVDFPDFESSRVCCDDRRLVCLLLSGENGRIGLVKGIGHNSLTRLLTDQVVKGVSIEGQQIQLRLRDTTLPHVNILINNDTDRAAVYSAFEKLARPVAHDNT